MDVWIAFLMLTTGGLVPLSGALFLTPATDKDLDGRANWWERANEGEE